MLGVDYSEGMLRRASALVKSEGWQDVTLQREDAAVLAGVEGPFDVLVSVWCLDIVHDLEAALERGLSLLRPGAKLAIMDFRRVRAESGPLHWFFPLYGPLLRVTGIDSREDLDDERYVARWCSARAWLEPRIEALHEERSLADTGFVLIARKR